MSKRRVLMALGVCLAGIVAAAQWAVTAQQRATKGSTAGYAETSSASTPSDAALQALLDKQAIHEVLVRYCRGVDRGDLELLRSVYHADAVDDHGTFKGNGWEFAANLLGRRKSGGPTGLHVITNESIELHGDAANVETYVMAHSPGNENGKRTLFTFGGRYIDRFERRNGEWKIAHRQVVHDFSHVENGPFEPWPSASAFTQGVTGKADISYRR